MEKMLNLYKEPHQEYQYLNILKEVLEFGESRQDRTEVGTLSLFGKQMRFDLSTGEFPAVTTKKLAFKSVVSELLWFLEGSTDERRLAEIHYGKPRDQLTNKTTIWTKNASEWAPNKYADQSNSLPTGNIYGAMWRAWPVNNAGEAGSIDQVNNLIESLKNNPHGRRHILSAWNPSELSNMCLPPCHALSQWYVNNKNQLSCMLFQRSNDVPCGIPFNIASYSLLIHMIAQVCGYTPGELIHCMGDAHIYMNQIDQVKLQLSREPYKLPQLQLNSSITNINDFKVEDFKLINYKSHPAILMPMN